MLSLFFTVEMAFLMVLPYISQLIKQQIFSDSMFSKEYPSRYKKVSTTGMVVSLKTDLLFPEPRQQGHGARIIQQPKNNKSRYSCVLDN